MASLASLAKVQEPQSPTSTGKQLEVVLTVVYVAFWCDAGGLGLCRRERKKRRPSTSVARLHRAPHSQRPISQDAIQRCFSRRRGDPGLAQRVRTRQLLSLATRPPARGHSGPTQREPCAVGAPDQHERDRVSRERALCVAPRRRAKVKGRARRGHCAASLALRD